jgi:hypothetical protein
VSRLTANIPALLKSALEAEAARRGLVWSIRTRGLTATPLCGRKAGHFESVARGAQDANWQRPQRAKGRLAAALASR